ncbi:sensor histidine kinase [Roseateles sp.]|uniref:sensor histidine kinase n=1 Tax=Roseateles sp. TaxID=1971397 RepID=UPI00286BD307|nr:histidine kinase [Roseateles sp.]
MTSNPPPAKPLPLGLLRRALNQLAIVLAITAVFSLIQLLVFRQPWGIVLLFTFCISAACSTMIQLLSCGSTYWLNQRRPKTEPPLEWPGWPLMSLSLVLGTFLGAAIGNELGNLISGLRNPSLHSGDLRNLLSILLISLLPGMVVTFYFVNRSHIASANAQLLTAQRLAAENKLRLLESQLEPHMLFNTLANLRVLIGLDPSRAQAMLDQLIAFLRATLNASRSGSHPLREEFARLNDYLGLMQIRMGARLRPVLDLPAELAELSIAPLLLQPLVENAIKHGLEPAIEGGELRVTARRVGRHLQLTVSDSGVGLSQAGSAEAQAGSGFGLHQVRERLATQYGPAATLNIAPAAGSGTLVTVEIPIETP